MSPVGVVGLGVVGGTVASVFEKVGERVVGYDRYLEIGEPEDLAGSEVVFLCVPTPIGQNGSHDLTEIWSAIREIAPHLDRGTVVAIKSTVAPGTSDALAKAFPELEIAFVPEFLVERRAEETFTRPDRVVIGASTHEAASSLARLMSLVAPTSPVLLMLPLEAELVKLCSNAMLAAKVAVANELSDVCARFDVPWTRVQAAVGMDRRIGPDHITVTPERGFGGTCLPKDLDGFIGASREAGHDPTLLGAVATFNRMIRAQVSSGEAPEEVGADR